MTRPSNDIEKVVDAAADVLKALKRLDTELEQLADSDDPFISKDKAAGLDSYRFITHYTIKQTRDTWRWLTVLYEDAAQLEEEIEAEERWRALHL
ncbi:hypothetical protein [Gleimia europaea]|uniref:hypothetical protein n=1 Tax=Gleimia europaea TaxID=66228 RepID=UPI000C7FD2E0|nr:hypothetical protein [Gleimia europaea]WIK62590.1 hypothetical protein CJ185_008755 [Gleimia europaea]